MVPPLAESIEDGTLAKFLKSMISNSLYMIYLLLLVIFSGYWWLTSHCFDVWEQGLVTGLLLMNQLLKLKQIRYHVHTTCKCLCEGFGWLYVSLFPKEKLMLFSYSCIRWQLTFQVLSQVLFWRYCLLSPEHFYSHPWCQKLLLPSFFILLSKFVHVIHWMNCSF